MNIISPSSAADAVTAGGLPAPVARRRLLRASSVLLAAVASSAVWLLARAAGTDFTLTAAGKSLTIILPMVTGFTLWFGALGWAALALLERYTSTAAKTWTRLASGVLLLSFVPIFAEHANTATRISLVLIHLTVATTLILALRHTTRNH